MCGIFGIITNVETALGPTLFQAGKRLAYRGYDSVGCATVAADGSIDLRKGCLLYTSPSPRDRTRSRMPSSA